MKLTDSEGARMLGIKFEAIRSKGFTLIGQVYDGRNVKNDYSGPLFEAFRHHFELSFVYRYYWPYGDRSMLIERGLIWHTNDVNNVVETCGNMWTIIAWRNLPTEIGKLYTPDVHKPYIKMLENDIEKGKN